MRSCAPVSRKDGEAGANRPHRVTSEGATNGRGVRSARISRRWIPPPLSPSSFCAVRCASLPRRGLTLKGGGLCTLLASPSPTSCAPGPRVDARVQPSLPSSSAPPASPFVPPEFRHSLPRATRRRNLNKRKGIAAGRGAVPVSSGRENRDIRAGGKEAYRTVTEKGSRSKRGSVRRGGAVQRGERRGQKTSSQGSGPRAQRRAPPPRESRRRQGGEAASVHQGVAEGSPAFRKSLVGLNVTP